MPLPQLLEVPAPLSFLEMAKSQDLDDCSKIPVEDDDAGEDEFLLATQIFDSNKEKVSFFKAKHILKGSNPFTTSCAWKTVVHIITCFLIAAQLAASSNYLFYKAKLYIRNASDIDIRSAPWILLLLFLEFFYFVASLIAATDSILPPSERPDLHVDCDNYPTVHIFLPCCREPTDVPVDSIRAALKMDYPSDRFKVLVLDDGGDDDLKAICETLQVETGGQVVYLRREKIHGVPHHFKCGNLNYGLEHSNSEYVVMMDADMILHPSFLRRLLPHIVNAPDISFVQIPQTFYNLPLGDPLNDSSILGYERELPQRDSLGYATCVGTGCLFRRKHLDAIGGFQPQSITEDTLTSYALFNEGYRSVYLKEMLQIGVTPWTLEGYIKQRCRWCQGAMQQLKSSWKVMLGKDSKLNFHLKIQYFWYTGYYFQFISNFLLVACLLGILLFEVKVGVGTYQESRQLIVNLSYNIIFVRLLWNWIFLQVPQSIQSRNRGESAFWWMSPFFVKMMIESFFSYKSTFNFVPTSTIDRNAANVGEKSHWKKKLGELKHVRFHLAYTFVVVTLVIAKIYSAIVHYGLNNCGAGFWVFGMSVFLLTTCAHMMLPVMYILWPTNFKPSQRKSLLKYDADGVPIFEPGSKDYMPRWHWSVVFYEAISVATLAGWTFVLWLMKTGADERWCTSGSLLHV